MSLTTVALRVHHLEAMADFYSQAFGFEFRDVETGPITSKFGEAGGITIKLVPLRDAADFEGFPSHQLGFAVADIDAVVELAQQCGGAFDSKVENPDGSVNHACVRDPDGNTVELYSP